LNSKSSDQIPHFFILWATVDKCVLLPILLKFNSRKTKAKTQVQHRTAIPSAGVA